ncbi:unnamed protein product [Brugia pahangi]|uniref:Superoxide dismutase n=1 Tax=Brugia pahangi TaxID=6280 RepID=A0A0N4TBA1_BRUPA|nr:unnamed protein product [Brugia pahangi]
MHNNMTITIRRTITKTATAIAVLHSDNGNINGTIHFQQDKNSTTISGEIKGLTPGLHGFHVHQYGDTTNGCISAGPHFNPYNKTHGDPTVSFNLSLREGGFQEQYLILNDVNLFLFFKFGQRV